MSRLLRTAWGAALLYAVLTVALTWPLAKGVARDVPGDLVDPLFTCWALAWNFHVFGLSHGGPATSYWDANIFFPTPRALARSEHFLAQALQGAPVFALTHELVLTYNLLFLSTFMLSGTFFYLLAREETGDRGAALVGGLLFAFALFRWAQVGHLGALSSQWMPLALLLARRAARADRGWPAAGWVLALGAVTALQGLSSGYYLLFFTPFLVAWAAAEAIRAGSVGAWLRLAAGGALATVLVLPMVLPYAALNFGGARRELDEVVANSADLLSWATAPERTLVWGRLLHAFPRGEARLFPGIVTPLLAMVALTVAVRAGWAASLTARPDANGRRRWPRLRSLARPAAIVLAGMGLAGLVAAVQGGLVTELGPFSVRALGTVRPATLMVAAVGAAAIGWPRVAATLRVLFRRREVFALTLSALAAWLSLGPIVTARGWPVRVPSAYAWLYANVPGFESGRAPARFAMVAACFAALAAAWGVAHLRSTGAGGRWAWVATVLFVIETAAVPLPLDQQGLYLAGPYQWEAHDFAALPAWSAGQPSAIVGAVRELPPEAVLAALPMGELSHETRAMFDSAHHWRRMLNGYSSWIPPEYVAHVVALRDPLRDAPGALAAMRAAGVTHIVVHEGAWTRGRGPKVTERLTRAGARPLTRTGDVALLAVR